MSELLERQVVVWSLGWVSGSVSRAVLKPIFDIVTKQWSRRHQKSHETLNESCRFQTRFKSGLYYASCPRLFSWFLGQWNPNGRQLQRIWKENLKTGWHDARKSIGTILQQIHLNSDLATVAVFHIEVCLSKLLCPNMTPHCRLLWPRVSGKSRNEQRQKGQGRNGDRIMA